MGSLGAYVCADVNAQLAVAAETAMADYHARLQERVRRVLETAAATPADDVLDMDAVNAHLRKRHAAYEMRQQLRNQAMRYEMLYRRALDGGLDGGLGAGLRHELEERRRRDRQQVLEQCYRGVDLHYAAVPAVVAAASR